jgi:hypothetical protein
MPDIWALKSLVPTASEWEERLSRIRILLAGADFKVLSSENQAEIRLIQ